MIIIFEGQYQGVSVRYLPDGKLIQLLEEIHLPNGDIVPAGFTCDLDTVPRWLGPMYAWLKGRTVLGAIVHDWAYSVGMYRKEADNLLLLTMEWEGVRKRYRLPIYYAVRGFGKSREQRFGQH